MERQLDLFEGYLLDVKLDSKLAERLVTNPVDEWHRADEDELVAAIEKALHDA